MYGMSDHIQNKLIHLQWQIRTYQSHIKYIQGQIRLIHRLIHLVIVLLNFYFQKCRDPNFDAPTRHRMSSEGSFFFFFKLITFTLAYSYNVKQLNCIIFCSNGLQNIYTSSIYGSVQHLQYLHWFTKFHIQNRPKGLPVGTY